MSSRRKAVAEVQQPPKRGRGRPPRISREEVIATSLGILAHTEVEEFKIKTLAAELGTTSMAIYNYFDSRDDLLEAISDEICGLFETPAPAETWQDTLRGWLWALRAHAAKYPVMPYVVGVNGHASAGWLKVTLPVTLILHDELGLRGKALAQAAYIFVTGAITLINVVARSGEYMQAKVYLPLEEIGLSAEQREVIKTLPIDALDEDQIIASVFEQLIAGVGRQAGLPVE
ncbi:MAG: TetR/AcrR family transcriptional regulator [Halioglobus sp.]|nr:TetR/AcrR family transcriptional regulator [Halioglobus sp.]